MLCNINFQSQYALINGVSVNVNDVTDKNINAYCINNHPLIIVQGTYKKWHFRHKCSNDVCNTNPITAWHSEWQGNFENTEIVFKKIDEQIKERRADIVENDYVIEIQHSKIERQEVLNRNNDYILHNKKVIWIIDGNKSIDVKNNMITSLYFKDDHWKYESFLDCPIIYYDISGLIYRVNPSNIGSLTVNVEDSILKIDFIDILKKGIHLWDIVKTYQCKLTIKQQGAGNGKTWGIINMIQDISYSHYNKFIFVSKAHSAKSIIKEEFLSQYGSGTLKISNVVIKEVGKKFIIEYINNIGMNVCIIIATIDSFMYSIGDKNNNSYNLFEGIVDSIIKNHMDIKKNGTINFAKTLTPTKLCSETLYILDEAQDITSMYADALLKIMQYTHMDAYIVGDKLQSICNDQNAFITFQDCTLSKIEKVILEPINICRRFAHPELVKFVNYMIPFKENELKPVSIEKEDYYENPLDVIWVDKKDDDKYLNQIMVHYDFEVKTNKYLPENFLIVTPFVSNNPFVNSLNLMINEYWINKFKNIDRENLNEYWKEQLKENDYYNYSVFHKSEEGSSINLDDSKYSTRIVSIHSSKGDGREVVFVINLNESSLRVYSGLKESLIYNSLLHVAITRMKKKLYIMCNKYDAIGQKIYNYMLLTDNVVVNNFNISKKININKDNILKLCGMEIIKEIHENYDDSTEAKDIIIDMSHHNIRYGIMFMRILLLLKNQSYDRISEINVKIDISLDNKKCPIYTCACWKEYNFHLKLILGTPEKGYKDAQVCIPIIKFKGKEYTEYYNIIKNNIDSIKYNIKTKKELCPLQLIILYYMYSVSSDGIYTRFTIIELYNIIHNYKYAYKMVDGHDNCLCNQSFKNDECNNSLSKYLLAHYEKIYKLDLLVKNLNIMYPNTNFNPNQSNLYEGKNNDFIIETRIALVGYNSKNAILCYIKPELNKLNYNEILIKSYIDTFILCNTSERAVLKFEKYNNKDLIVCILALNLDEPHIIDFENISDNLNLKIIILDSLYNYYSIKNKEVFQYYKSYINTCNETEISLSEFKDKYNVMDDLFKNAPYINDFIKQIETNWDDSDDKDKYIQNLNVSFMEKINNTLDKSLHSFFGLKFKKREQIFLEI